MISIIKSWHQEGHPANEYIWSMEINKTAKYITVLTNFKNRPTLPQCGKHGVDLY